MTQADQLVLGADEQGLPIGHLLRFANRHGLIAGATGTGKTVTMQRLAEAFNRFARIQNDVKTLCVQDLSVQFVYKSKTDWE